MQLGRANCANAATEAYGNPEQNGMDLDRLYSFLFELDCFFLITCALLVAAASMIVLRDDLVPKIKERDRREPDSVSSGN